MMSYKNTDIITDWFNNGGLHPFCKQNFCETRSDFNGRLFTYEKQLSAHFSEDCQSLILSSLGEIGNNCFDHNLGYWQDEPGCLFIREEKFCIIADRGQGIKNSLQKVYKLAENDSSYISVAFHQVITGRAPEKRGNGLKFTRKNLQHCQVNLFCYSDGETFILSPQNQTPPLPIKLIKGSGTFTLIYW